MGERDGARGQQEGQMELELVITYMSLVFTPSKMGSIAGF